MAVFTTRDGTAWEPAYLASIDRTKCIGCGRCFKVCSRGVMSLYGLDGEDQMLGKVSGDEDDDDDFDGELVRKIMVLDNAGACIGCGACHRVCPKGCQTHVKATELAA